MIPNNYYTNYSRQRCWADIWHKPSDPDTEKTDYAYFNEFYTSCGVPNRLLSGPEYANYGLDTIYFLLTSRFANDHIASSDENRFKLQVMSLIMQHGPQWQRLMALQDKLLNLDDDDLLTGSTTIYNHAMHPDTDPSTQTLDELEYIDDQNVTKYKRDGLEGYSRLIPFLSSQATENFLRHFKKLFMCVVYSDDALTYITNNDTNEVTMWYDNYL